MPEIQITVWRRNGMYHSTIHSPKIRFLKKGSTEIFSIVEDIDIKQIKRLRKKAREKAQEMGLPKIISLDDGV